MSGVVRSKFFNIIKQCNSKKFAVRTFINYVKINSNVCSYMLNNPVTFAQPNLDFCRHKHNKKNQKGDLTESDEEEDTDNFEDQIVDKQSRIMNVKVNSLRADVILKAGLGIARNKIETMFYESKIRVNGKKLLKKSAMLNVGDEIDIVKGTSATNPDFLTVGRVEILSTSERSEGLNVKLRRNKSLTIENYDSDNLGNK